MHLHKCLVVTVGLQQTDDNNAAAAAATAADDEEEEEEETEMVASADTEGDMPMHRECAEQVRAVPLTLRSVPLTSASGLPLIAVKSTSREWTDEDMMLDWTQKVTVRQLQRLRDFFVEGMHVNVVEEKVHFLSVSRMIIHVAFLQLCTFKR